MTDIQKLAVIFGLISISVLIFLNRKLITYTEESEVGGYMPAYVSEYEGIVERSPRNHGASGTITTSSGTRR